MVNNPTIKVPQLLLPHKTRIPPWSTDGAANGLRRRVSYNVPSNNRSLPEIGPFASLSVHNNKEVNTAMEWSEWERRRRARWRLPHVGAGPRETVTQASVTEAQGSAASRQHYSLYRSAGVSSEATFVQTLVFSNNVICPVTEKHTLKVEVLK